MNMNTLIVGLIIYSIVTTCYLFGVCVNTEKNAFIHCFLNAILSLIIFGVVIGIIKVFIFFQ